MNRLPLVASFILFIALCASGAYWAMQLFKPPVRPVAAPPRVAKTDIKPDAAAGLFGGRGSKAAVATNYQLKGVIMSGTARDSVAILSAEGKPAQAIRVNMEIEPGVTIKEVHREYVLLADGGVTKRVELPESAKDQSSPASISPVASQPSILQRTPAQRVPPPSAPPATITPQPPQALQQPRQQPAQPLPQTQPLQSPQATAPMQPVQPAQPVPPGTVPPAPATAAGAMPPAVVSPTPSAGGSATQLFNPPPSAEPAPANPPASPEPGMPPARTAPTQ